MTVGLIRSESAGDLRTLTATGATGRTRRTLTAATAGALAFLGALLGVAGVYVAYAATYHDDLGYLGRIPVFPSSSWSPASRWRLPRPAGSSPAASRPPSRGLPSSDVAGAIVLFVAVLAAAVTACGGRDDSSGAAKSTWSANTTPAGERSSLGTCPSDT